MQYENRINQGNVERYRIFRVVLLVIGLIFVGRLFFIQVVQHGYYTARADTSHLKKLELEATRGEIYVQDGDEMVPIALNQTLKRVVADPRYVGDAEETARQLAEVTGGDVSEYKKELERDTAYVVLEEGLSIEVGTQVAELNLKGIALRNTTKRVYPEGSLAAHVLGFVNSDGEGQYGVEQYLDDQISGKDGLLSGTFDVNGVPIATADNTEIEPVDGDDVVLTIDRRIQKQVEEDLKNGIERYEALSGSVVVMDPNNGAIKAMANYPTYNPGEYSEVDDISVFTNDAISSPYETGSVFKPLTMALGLQSGAVTPETTYFDQSYKKVDDFTIRNAGAVVQQTRDMTEVITKSVNTGVIFVLENLAGDKDVIDREDKQMLYDFFTKKLRLDKKTNVELAGEQTGTVYGPDRSDARYANMVFGQGISVNMLQNLAAEAAVINGGTYYQPHIVDRYIKPDGASVEVGAQALDTSVVSEQVSKDIREMMETVVERGGGYTAYRSGFRVGGKTGSAQVANLEAGGYEEGTEIGSFVGFAPVEKPRYIVMVRINEPQNTATPFAGSGAAAPVFGQISDWLLNYYGITPNTVE